MKNIESNLVFPHNDLSFSIRVFSRVFRLWDLTDISTFFFHPYFTLRTIFSGYCMILKQNKRKKKKKKKILNKLMPLITNRKKKKFKWYTYEKWLKNGPKMKVFKFCFFTKHMCQIHQIWRYLTVSLKNIESNLVFPHNDLSVSIKVFSKGFRLWGLIDMSTCFFSSLF